MVSRTGPDERGRFAAPVERPPFPGRSTRAGSSSNPDLLTGSRAQAMRNGTRRGDDASARDVALKARGPWADARHTPSRNEISRCHRDRAARIDKPRP